MGYGKVETSKVRKLEISSLVKVGYSWNKLLGMVWHPGESRESIGKPMVQFLWAKQKNVDCDDQDFPMPSLLDNLDDQVIPGPMLGCP